MKKALLSLLSLALLWTACKEQIPAGLIIRTSVSADTSYVTTTETPQEKNILIEELTGATCSNCPKGTKILKDYQTAHPDRIIVTAIHSGFLADPVPGALYDFRNPDSDTLRLFFNEGDAAKPSACFDRVQATSGNSAGKYFISKGQTGGDWDVMLNSRLPLTTPVNLHLTSAWNTATSKIDVTAKIAFTSAVTDKLALTLYVLESGRLDKQADIDLGIVENYEFNHILRKLITPVTGDPVLDSLSTKEPGRVLERIISFTPITDGVNGWNLDSCHVVGIVHKTGTSKEVLQVQEVHMK